MSVKELAEFIRKNKPGINYPGVHLSEDEGVVLQYTRHEMNGDVHITDEHVFECCMRAGTFDEHIELCRPLARIDTEDFKRQKNKPAGKGRTKRRFK